MALWHCTGMWRHHATLPCTCTLHQLLAVVVLARASERRTRGTTAPVPLRQRHSKAIRLSQLVHKLPPSAGLLVIDPPPHAVSQGTQRAEACSPRQRVHQQQQAPQQQRQHRGDEGVEGGQKEDLMCCQALASPLTPVMPPQAAGVQLDADIATAPGPQLLLPAAGRLPGFGCMPGAAWCAWAWPLAWCYPMCACHT
eukprot:CAMPEP_0202866056 /NCGR_PEP_ID=MMETSP1391-20130828/7132_1 /ASSEMBLY_ACC=CAM_ASM_000867 /TAXON_ID=1034604 /ORGANISM="Chlamydomonas leiostraca, Strain SAG 11-49" /LENGTH=196 /DNA_ID=CAMNT_0049545967 /DNA_START=258 /DNA_END=850 /DNA_ORIENTATION=-